MKLTLSLAGAVAALYAPFAQGAKAGPFRAEVRVLHTTAQGLPSNDVQLVRLTSEGRPAALTAAGGVEWRDNQWRPAAVAAPAAAPIGAPDGRLAETRADGIYLKERQGAWRKLAVRQDARSWDLAGVRLIAFDSLGRLWFAVPQGVGCHDGKGWKLYTGAEGLPYDDFTAIAAGEGGVMWFGTRIGAIRFDGQAWEYRQGPRWLPHDEVRSIAVDSQGNAWIATAGGISFLERRPMTLREKARIFEEEIDRRHRRTPYQYVHPVNLKRAGDPGEWTHTDSDNDGLWTSMYGAGECYAFAATGSQEARKRAAQAFEALRFLRVVTQGGSHPAPLGFLARSILPVSGPDPNLRDSPARDRERQKHDRRWKVIAPRWPRSADGQWYWKTDTSSDELDGHYFFYGLYYDLVARGEERERVREHVAAITDHLLVHNYTLVDHDGRPTRWAIFSPDELNYNHDWWEERGMNSASILAYLQVARHITGDEKYERAARVLVERHSYAANALIPKTHLGPGAGNQSDDEMIFMNMYNLLKYETNPDLRQKFLLAFHNHFQNEQPEMNPLFNFLYAAVARKGAYTDAFGDQDVSPGGEWLEDALDSLRRIPLDRVDWALKNSHRKDLVPLAPQVRRGAERACGARVNGKVLPADERYIGHWNHDPWRLDFQGAARTLADGAIFLLPYYMGLHYGFIEED